MNAVATNSGVGIIIKEMGRIFDRQNVVLKDINLQISAGDFVSILGPSGCGKSTLLRLIAHLDRPTHGSVQFLKNGELHRSLPRTGVAYVFQDAHLLPWRNVLRNVELPLELTGHDRSQRRQAAIEAIEQVGLKDALGKYPAQLSGGMRMRVSLARALVTRPQLLLLDEPFAALDEITRQQLDDQLRQLWLDRQLTVVFVTHSTTEAAYLSQRALVMAARPGRFVLDHLVALPSNRSAELRGSPEFAAQTRVLYEALENGAAR